jgi:dihydropteroate synthase
MSPATQTTSTQRMHFDWRLRTRSLALGERTLVMAILNVTPDSFSGDGLLAPELSASRLTPAMAKMAGNKMAIALAVQAVDAGADIIDLGAESTRPNAVPIEPYEEQDRLLPVLEGLLAARPRAIVSVDTYHAETARAACRAGAEIVNDVSGLNWDDEMAAAAAASGCGLVLAHARGRSWEWSSLPALLPADIVPTVYQGLCESLMRAEEAGIARSRIVTDPGFGLGKRGRENITLLSGLGRLRELGRPLLVGLSRKRFLGELAAPVQPPGVKTVADSRRAATIAANVAAILAGAHIVRVHDVQATREAAAVADAVLKSRE